MGRKWAIDDRAQLDKDVNQLLDQNLLPGETVRVIIRGSWDQAMIGTDRRIFVFKKGMMSGATLGKKLASWDYANVGGVHVETGWWSGFALVQVPGLPSIDVGRGRTDKEDPAKLPNAVPLSGMTYLTQAKEGAALLRQLIATYQHGRHAAPAPAQPDVVSQLERLGALRDGGVLTAGEFEAKKAELLARL